MAYFTIALGSVAALTNGIAFLLYGRQTRLKLSSPNAASWSIWAFLATLNAFSYHEMTGDAVATLQFFVGSAGCIATFLYALVIGRFAWSELKRNDWWCFALGLLATLVWYALRSAAWANMIALGAFAVSFIPTLKGVIEDPQKEAPLPWLLWTFGFCAATTNAALRSNNHIALLSPGLLLISHALVAVLSARTRKEQYRHAAA